MSYLYDFNGPYKDHPKCKISNQWSQVEYHRTPRRALILVGSLLSVIITLLSNQLILMVACIVITMYLPCVFYILDLLKIHKKRSRHEH